MIHLLSKYIFSSIKSIIKILNKGTIGFMMTCVFLFHAYSIPIILYIYIFQVSNYIICIRLFFLQMTCHYCFKNFFLFWHWENEGKTEYIWMFFSLIHLLKEITEYFIKRPRTIRLQSQILNQFRLGSVKKILNALVFSRNLKVNEMQNQVILRKTCNIYIFV